MKKILMTALLLGSMMARATTVNIEYSPMPLEGQDRSILNGSCVLDPSGKGTVTLDDTTSLSVECVSANAAACEFKCELVVNGVSQPLPSVNVPFGQTIALAGQNAEGSATSLLTVNVASDVVTDVSVAQGDDSVTEVDSTVNDADNAAEDSVQNAVIAAPVVSETPADVSNSL